MVTLWLIAGVLQVLALQRSGLAFAWTVSSSCSLTTNPHKANPFSANTCPLWNSRNPEDTSERKSATSDLDQAVVNGLKAELLQKIREFRTLQDRDGAVAIDFGVKGGELNSTSRAPQKVDFYSISKDVGDKAEEILELCQNLTSYATIEEPTKFLGDRDRGAECPLQGPWKLLFTTAADASFSKNSTRGDAKAQNIVDAANGKITNQIDFANKEDGTEPVLKQLNVVIRAFALGPKRVGLEFKYAKAVLTRFLWWKVRWSLYIPVPAAFITRCIVFFSRLFKGTAKKVPKAYFDILYLDNQLRVHKTGEDNIFVQARDDWTEAKPLLL